VRLPQRRSNLFSTAVLAATLSACSGAAEIPDTPDMSEMLAAYRSPSAELDTTTANEVLAELPDLEQLAAGFRAARYTTNGVDEGSGSSDKDSALRVQGSIRVTLRCPGEDPDPVFDANTNGSISMTLAVEENRIKRSVRAVAAVCRLRGELASLAIPIEVDGPVLFDLGGDVGLRDKWSGELLMSIEETLIVGGFDLGKVSARWTGERLEHLFDRPNGGGTVVAELRTLASGDPGIGLRDHTRVWGCRDGGCVEEQ
jgi:hypothetical protein